MHIACTPCSRGCDPRARTRGISLVELMVTLAIGLVVVLIATTIYVHGTLSFSFRMGQSENLSNSRYALNTLDTEFSKAGYRRDPAQRMVEAFPADAAAHPNGCQFAAGQAIYAPDARSLCIRYQPRDNDEQDCAGTAAGISGLPPYEAPSSPTSGAGLFVEKYALDDNALVCFAGPSAVATPVASGVRDLRFEFGVGPDVESMAERRVETFQTDPPDAEAAIRSLRYTILLASSSERITGGIESTLCTRWEALGGEPDSCETSSGKFYQLASGSLTLRNLMP